MKIHLSLLGVIAVCSIAVGATEASDNTSSGLVGRDLQHQCSLSAPETGETGTAIACQAALENCNSKTIAGCTIHCIDDGACESAVLEDSVVDCDVTRSCFASTHRRNQVTCAEDTSTCPNSIFVASAVDCQGSSSCSFSEFYSCSCCTNSAHCPEGVPLCIVSDDRFCAQLHLGQTCKDWGNPVCDAVEVESSPPPIHPASTCNLNQDVVICHDGSTECSGIPITGCSLDCFDGTCEGSTIQDSTVMCANSRACQSSSITRSTVICDQGIACTSTTFTASAVECKKLGACNSVTTFEGACNCCDGPGCPDGLLSCVLQREDFCANRRHRYHVCRRGQPCLQDSHDRGTHKCSLSRTDRVNQSFPDDDAYRACYDHVPYYYPTIDYLFIPTFAGLPGDPNYARCLW